MKILVVGAGTAGLISALILKKKLDCQVDVLYSEQIGIVGVGEGSTEHFSEFLEYVGIDYKEIIKECGATYKAGILFDGWSEKKYMHSVIYPYDQKNAQYSIIYAKCILDNKMLHPEYFFENILPIDDLNLKKSNFNQYHFDTNKLNDFLIKKCKKNGIVFFEDLVVNVNIDNEGKIENLLGNKKNYYYDFYIDSTGLKGMLISKMGGKWKSFSEYLNMNSAIVFSSGDEENYNLGTLSKAMDYGWRFKIPTWGRHGNGYIYDNNYISSEQARLEIEKDVGFEVKIAKEFHFDPGYIDRPWIKNCCAIGLSSSFVEPLEASSIGTSIQQAFLLMHRISNYSDLEIKEYNKNFASIMNNVRDFIFLHYRTKRKNTDMWKDISKREAPESLKNKMSLWENRLPIQEDFFEDSNYCLFRENNFIHVLNGLDLINTESIQKEYSSNNIDIKKYIEVFLKKQRKYEQKIKKNTHKQFLKHIKDNF